MRLLFVSLSAALAFSMSGCSGEAFESDRDALEAGAGDGGGNGDAGGSRQTGGRQASGGSTIGGATASGGTATSGGRMGAGGSGNGGFGNGPGAGGRIGAGGTGTGTGGANPGSGGAGTGGATASGGAPPGCGSASDCPDAPTPCQFAVCIDGHCGTIVNNTTLPQTSGDCRKLQCNNGDVEVIFDNADSDDGNPCTRDSCAAGVVSHEALVGTACNGGTWTCNAQGQCIQCVTDGECGMATQCTTYACVQGTCRTTHAPRHTFCNGFLDQCDGSGNCVDCTNSGACDECCVCSTNQTCIPA